MLKSQLLKVPFAGIPGRKYALRSAVEGAAPVRCVRNLAGDVIELVASEFLAGRETVTSSADELSGCRCTLNILPWYRYCYPPAIIFDKVFLSMDKGRCREESHDAKDDLSALLKHLSGVPVSVSGWERRVLTRDIAMALGATCRVSESLNNLYQALEYARRARMVSRDADAELERWALYLYARILQKVGQSLAAEAMRQFADRLVVPGPSSLLLDFRLWHLAEFDLYGAQMGMAA